MKLNFWIGILISAAAVAFLVYQVNFGEVADAFRTAHYGWIMPGVFCAVSLIFIRAWRWRYLLREDLQTSFDARLSATFIGFMASGLLPARIGEFVRAWCLGHRSGKSKSAVFASIIIERLLDGLWLLMYLVIALWVVPFPEGGDPGSSSPGATALGGVSMRSGLRWAGFFSFFFYAGIILFLVFLRVAREKTLRFVDWLLVRFSPRFAKKAEDTLDGFIQGIYVPIVPAHLMMILWWTILLWTIGLGTNYFTLLAFGQYLPWHAVLLIIVMQAIGVMIPSSPGFVGTFHAVTVMAAMFYGVSEGAALSFAVVVHIVAFGPIVLIGLGCLWKENLTLGRIVTTREEPAG